MQKAGRGRVEKGVGLALVARTRKFPRFALQYTGGTRLAYCGKGDGNTNAVFAYLWFRLAAQFIQVRFYVGRCASCRPQRQSLTGGSFFPVLLSVRKLFSQQEAQSPLLQVIACKIVGSN